MTDTTPRPTFICDAMLGRLATWLRLLGYDAAFAFGVSDEQLIQQAAREGRILLTRNRRLLAHRAVSILQRLEITSDHFREQLTQTVRAFGLDRRMEGYFCARCNLETEPVSLDRVRDEVPPFVAAHQTDFRRCPDCGRVYWAATHADGMSRELDDIFAQSDHPGEDCAP